MRFTRFLPIGVMASAALAQVPPPSSPVADVVVNMRGVEIADVAEQISRITGRTLILDPTVKGVVNVTSAEPLTVNGVWDLFQSVLRVQGFAAVRSGRAWRIIPQANAVRDGGAVSRGSAQDVVTRLVRLRNVPSEAAARVFRPLVASFGTIEALPSPNAIVITDYAENVRRIEAVARALDSGGGGSFETVTLRYATARDVAAAIQGIMGDQNAAGGPRVIADERSNIVIIRGEPNALADARRLARTLDQPGGATPTTRMFRLSNGDAEAITDVLRGLMGEQGGATNAAARSLRPRASLGSGRSGNSLGAPGSGTVAALAGALNGGLAGATGGAIPASGITLPDASGSSGPATGFSTPDLTIQPAPELNAIVVRGTPAAIAAIEPLITQLDIRRPQVTIEAAIVEITGDDAEALGIQLGLGSAALNAGDGAATSFSTVGPSLQQILAVLGAPAAVGLVNGGLSGNLSIGNNFSILVQALGQSTKANLLSTPSLTTLDNEAAEIVVGQSVPFRTGSFTTAGNTTNPFTTIERQDVGLTLRVIPRIHDGNVVRLEVAQEVSSLVGAVTGAADLITNRRSITTTVLADNGETIVLGGLITDDRQTSRGQVPVLGDVPVLGNLFKARSVSKVKRTLFVFLKPTILRDSAATASATRAKYAKVRGEEQLLSAPAGLLLHPPQPRLPSEIEGLY